MYVYKEIWDFTHSNIEVYEKKTSVEVFHFTRSQTNSFSLKCILCVCVFNVFSIFSDILNASYFRCYGSGNVVIVFLVKAETFICL